MTGKTNKILDYATLILAVCILILVLSGCAPAQINYEGKLRDTTEVQEIISDKLEVENPGLDLDVSIFEDAD